MWSTITTTGFNDLHPVITFLSLSFLRLTILCIFQGSNIGITVAGFTIGSGASRSELYYPSAIRVTANQTMFILDTNNYRILRWQLNEPLGYVVAGGRGSGATFDRMGLSYGMFVDDQMNIYISEQGNHRVTFWSQGNTTAGVLVKPFVVSCC